jgi:amino acid adenylation domain-containing protein
VNMSATHLSQLLERSATERPNSIAVEDERGERLTYAQLDRIADRLATRLAKWGISRGDRVGVLLPKSLDAVCAIQGILRAGAAYVPIDPTAPPRRGMAIFADAGVKAAIVTSTLVPTLRANWPASRPAPRLVAVGSNGVEAAADATWNDILCDNAPSPLPPARRSSDLAYILYTSGSTGDPKGVMLSHANAYCFLDWCAATFDLRPDDRVASHAPFHFDLSVFDIHATCRRGATLVLAGESLGKDPVRLGAYLSEKRIDVWYSAPSILALLAERGGIEQPDRRAPRLVLFAGEVFPIRSLKRLRTIWPAATLWNLYGPTETNVCTAHEIPEVIPQDRAEPFPIGKVCAPLRARVVDERGRDAPSGAEGELLITGPGVMRGYFGRPDLSLDVFQYDEQGIAWYRTGDLVIDDSAGAGCFTFRGRRDRMIKKRGYRIELGEIESALYHHEDVDRAAVLANNDDAGVSITAFVAVKPGRKTSIIAMKRHCTLFLPHYMVPDAISFLPSLPATSTDKVDYQGLRRIAEGA